MQDNQEQQWQKPVSGLVEFLTYLLDIAEGALVVSGWVFVFFSGPALNTLKPKWNDLL